jgi:hypothetical protein
LGRETCCVDVRLFDELSLLEHVRILAVSLILLLLISSVHLVNADLIPDWVKNNFIWYSQGQISENELLNAIKFLIENEIIVIEQDKEIEDLGDFYVVYDEVDNSYYLELEAYFKDSQELELLAEHLNENFALPYDVPIILTECGEVNAFYDPNDSSIVMCYELVEDTVNKFSDTFENDEDFETAVVNSISFILYHEIGHTLVDIYGLPITGKGEDAVDQFGAILMLETWEDGREAMYSTATYWIKSGEFGLITENQFADVHSLNIQRYYNLACLVYGSDPDSNAFLIDIGGLPEDRAVGCQSEYEKNSYSWNILLEPYLK